MKCSNFVTCQETTLEVTILCLCFFFGLILKMKNKKIINCKKIKTLSKKKIKKMLKAKNFDPVHDLLSLIW